MTETSHVVFIENEEAMLSFGGKIASFIEETAVIFLYGELGVGKTTWVRGFLKGLGHQGNVKSPTYALVENYHVAKSTVYHFDFYRLDDPEELEHMGIRDYFHEKVIAMIEWPEKGMMYLPPSDLSLHMTFFEEGREIKCVGESEQGQLIIERLRAS